MDPLEAFAEIGFVEGFLLGNGTFLSGSDRAMLQNRLRRARELLKTRQRGEKGRFVAANRDK